MTVLYIFFAVPSERQAKGRGVLASRAQPFFDGVNRDTVARTHGVPLAAVRRGQGG